MSTAPATTGLRLQITKHLISGKTLDQVAAITSLPRSEVLDIASHHGYPDATRLRKAAEMLTGLLERETAEGRPNPPAAPAPRPTAPHPTQGDTLGALLAAGRQHPTKRIQAAVQKVLDDIDRLRQLLEEDKEKNFERRKAEEAKAAVRAEVKRLEKQLRDAKAKLRGNPPKTAPTGGEHACMQDGCNRTFPTAQGRSLHERRAHAEVA